MNTKIFIKNQKLAQPWVFFLATYTWSWSFFGIAYLMGVSAESGRASGVILVLLALSGPAVMGTLLTYLALNKAGQKDYWVRIIDFKRIPFKWYLIIFLLIPAVIILADLLSGYWASYSFAHQLPSLGLTLLSVPLVPVLEELGWRYAIDRLQEKYSALGSTLILGVLWGSWHLPVFFLPNSIYQTMPFGSLIFWLYMVHAVVISFVFTWVYINTNRSILSAILLHTVLEFCANTGMIPWHHPEDLKIVMVWIDILWAIVAILLIHYNDSKTIKKNHPIKTEG